MLSSLFILKKCSFILDFNNHIDGFLPHPHSIRCLLAGVSLKLYTDRRTVLSMANKLKTYLRFYNLQAELLQQYSLRSPLHHPPKAICLNSAAHSPQKIHHTNPDSQPSTEFTSRPLTSPTKPSITFVPPYLTDLLR